MTLPHFLPASYTFNHFRNMTIASPHFGVTWRTWALPWTFMHRAILRASDSCIMEGVTLVSLGAAVTVAWVTTCPFMLPAPSDWHSLGIPLHPPHPGTFMQHLLQHCLQVHCGFHLDTKSKPCECHIQGSYWLWHLCIETLMKDKKNMSCLLIYLFFH